MTESPAAGRGVFPEVLDHELNPVFWASGHERLGTGAKHAKGLVVLLGRVEAPGYSGNDRAVGERKLSVAIGFDRFVVAQNGPDIVEFAFLASHRDQLPVAVSRGNLGDKNRGFLISASRSGRGQRDNAAQCCDSNQQEHDPFHKSSSCEYLSGSEW